MRPKYVICAVLIVLTAGVYARITSHPFVTFDDDLYITDNPHIQQGLTAESVKWALTTDYASFRFPIAWLSLMLDIELWGLSPQAMHRTALVLHVINVLLLFGVLRAMTGATWRSALVAALLAIHPQHVESVAWATERKDLVCALFWLIGLWAYVAYARRPNSWRYGLVVLAFVLALLGKPMAVTFPFLLLLLDWWPLNRLELRQWRSWRKLVIEKLPLLVLTIPFCYWTIIAQNKSATLASFDLVPMSWRLGNAVVSYVRYLAHAVMPTGLIVSYPLQPWPTWAVIASAALLVLITAAVLLAARKRYLAVGWFWFLGTMVPVIGLLQVGHHGMADRYTYQTMIGIYVAVVWGLADGCKALRLHTPTIATAAAIALASLGYLCWHQAGYWQNSFTLYHHALSVQHHNPLIHNNLGNLLLRRGLREKNMADLDQAVVHYRHAIVQRQRFWNPHYAYGKVLMYKKQDREALNVLQRALSYAESREEKAKTCYVLGIAHLHLNELDRAEAMLRKSLQLRPGHELTIRYLQQVQR